MIYIISLILLIQALQTTCFKSQFANGIVKFYTESSSKKIAKMYEYALHRPYRIEFGKHGIPDSNRCFNTAIFLFSMGTTNERSLTPKIFENINALTLVDRKMNVDNWSMMWFRMHMNRLECVVGLKNAADCHSVTLSTHSMSYVGSELGLDHVFVLQRSGEEFFIWQSWIGKLSLGIHIKKGKYAFTRDEIQRWVLEFILLIESSISNLGAQGPDPYFGRRIEALFGVPDIEDIQQPIVTQVFVSELHEENVKLFQWLPMKARMWRLRPSNMNRIMNIGK